MQHFPLLTVITFTPVAASLLLLMLPAERKTEIRMTALAAGLLTLFLSLLAYFSYNQGLGGYQFVEQHSWVPQLGISYHVGVDGISLFLC